MNRRAMSREAVPPTQPREAARVVLFDPAGEVLLLSGRDATRLGSTTFWFTPGGGVEAGESLEAAARREVLEETGHLLGRIGPLVWHRSTSFLFEGRRFVQDESFFVAFAERFEPRPLAWSELEVRTLTGARWWPEDELAASSVQLYPENLRDLLPGWHEVLEASELPGSG